MFRTFHQIKKATQPPHSGSALPPHSSPWTSAACDASMVLEEEARWPLMGGASESQLTSGIAGGWPMPMGPSLAILSDGLHGSSAVDKGDDATMVLLGWCLVRQWIQVPASTCCGGASFSSSSKWWTLLLFTETGAHGAEDVSLGLVQQTTEIPQLQYIDQVFDVLVVQFQQIRAKSWETVEIPQLQLEFSWTSCCTPVVCNNRCPWSSQLSTVVNVPVIMRDSGNAPE